MTFVDMSLLCICLGCQGTAVAQRVRGWKARGHNRSGGRVDQSTLAATLHDHIAVGFRREAGLEQGSLQRSPP